MERYSRQVILPEFGADGQKRLSSASVFIVGMGGLGVPVAQYLVAMGTGKVGLCDGDEVSVSNLHRQVIYNPDVVGQKKVEVAHRILSDQNPDVEIHIYDQMLSQENASELFQEYDVIIDCTDQLETRYLIDDVTGGLGKPWVYGALYQFEGQVSVFNLKDGPSYRDAFPDDQAKVENCDEIGTLGVLPGLIGTYQALEAVKIITGFAEPLSGKMLVVDTKGPDHFIYEIGERNNTPKKMETPKLDFIQWDDLEGKSGYFIDVRKPEAFDEFHDARFESVQFAIIEGKEFEDDSPIYLTCRTGKTAKMAAQLLKMKDIKNPIYLIEGGYSTYPS